MKYLIIYLVTILIPYEKFHITQQVNILGQMEISIPNEFIQLNDFELKKKYEKSPFTPKMEFSNSDDSTIIAISYGSNTLHISNIDNLRKAYVKRFTTLYPEAIWISTKTKSLNSFELAILETINNINYQLIFFTVIDEKQVHFTIKGNKDKIDTIQQIARSILNSIKRKN